MVKQILGNEIYLLIKYIKSVLWRVAKCLSYTEDARCLKVKYYINNLSCGIYDFVYFAFSYRSLMYRPIISLIVTVKQKDYYCRYHGTIMFNFFYNKADSAECTCTLTIYCSAVDCVWNVMAHAQKPDIAFLRNGLVRLNLRGHQFSRLLAAEVCASALVMLATPCFEVVWRVLATHSIRQFPFTSPPVRHCVPSRFNWTLPSRPTSNTPWCYQTRMIKVIILILN